MTPVAEYRRIPGYPNYEVSVKGVVRNVGSGNVLVTKGRGQKRTVSLYDRNTRTCLTRSAVKLAALAWGDGSEPAEALRLARAELEAERRARRELEDRCGRLADELAAARACLAPDADPNAARELELLRGENRELRATLAVYEVGL